MSGMRKPNRRQSAASGSINFQLAPLGSATGAEATVILFQSKGDSAMNILLKSAIAGALALGATGAYAIGVPATNSSDLILVVENNATQVTYAYDTGVTLNSLLPAGSYVSGAVLSTALPGLNTTISATSTLQTFLQSNPASGDSWALEGAQFNGSTTGGAPTNTVTKGVGKALGVFASGIGTINASAVSQEQLGAFQLYLGGLQASVGQSNGGMFPLTTSTETTAAQYTNDAAAPSAAAKYGMIGANDMSALGTSVQLFGFTGNGGTGTLQSYILGTAGVDASGNLTFTGNGTTPPPPVPLPAAVWLFGSGLMGLVGISRRRKTAVAA
jgi:hypothetical protein